MRLTVISDVHGNLPALEAVLRHARAHDASGIVLNLGDLTGYGPFPEQVVNWSRSPHVISLLGDYDQKVLSKQQRESQWAGVKTEDKRTMFAWTYQALSKEARQFLQELSEACLVELAGVNILMTHGKPEADSADLASNTIPEQLVDMAEQYDADIVVFGHTHRPFFQHTDGVVFVNPGTVGRPDDGDPRACYAILTIEEGQVLVEHFRVPYDIMASVRGLRWAGLSEIFTQVLRQGLTYTDVYDQLGEDPSENWFEPTGALALLTDFGLKDHFVGVMKGVIAGIAPQARMIDISHQVRPQSVIEGARMLAQAVPYFPAGTVFVAVVDPGVGTARRALAARIGQHFFVVPDNGLLTLVLENAQAQHQPISLISLTKPAYWLSEISAIFHGRDVFAPVGAHLVNGIPLRCLGEPIDDPCLISLPQPQRTADGWQAEVMFLDGFGNICTNLLGVHLAGDHKRIRVRIGDVTLHGLCNTFGDAAHGELIALIDSTGHLAIAKVNGDAAEQLKVHIGNPVWVELDSSRN